MAWWCLCVYVCECVYIFQLTSFNFVYTVQKMRIELDFVRVFRKSLFNDDDDDGDDADK